MQNSLKWKMLTDMRYSLKLCQCAFSLYSGRHVARHCCWDSIDEEDTSEPPSTLLGTQTEGDTDTPRNILNMAMSWATCSGGKGKALSSNRSLTTSPTQVHGQVSYLTVRDLVYLSNGLNSTG